MPHADVISPQRWPAAPYKGLTYYTGADAVLFAGREDDIVRCGALLADWELRVLLLHGATGCGKSSFLRAGLIPYLESASAGIAFARTEAADHTPLMFVRSTADPLRNLADSVYTFANREVTKSAPDGHFTLRLRDALPAGRFGEAAEFRQLCGEDPDVLLDVLRKLSGMVPETLVLIIDQGEEVLTVDLSPEGERCRNRFFEFVSDFVRASLDLKLAVALRTEYLGRFVSRARRKFRGKGISEYYLDTLRNDQVAEAISRPTSTAPVKGLGAPREYYRFTFGEGVVDKIISELANPGTNLPAVQIVCSSLYEMARSRIEPWKIELSDLTALGGVEGSVGRFIDVQIRLHCEDVGLSPGESDQEIDLWKAAMFGLTREQPDGTVTTDLKRESILREELEASRLDFDRACAHFASDDIRLLRKVKVVKAGEGTLVPCVGLGHDVLGLVLQKWMLSKDQLKEGLTIQYSEPGELKTVKTPDGMALCLSGGGYRAVLFHLGALWRLNEIGCLQKLDLVSAASGGAIVAALLGLRWKMLTFRPEGVASNFEETLVAPLRLLTEHTIDFSAALTSLLLPFKGSGANELSARLARMVYGKATLQDWPDKPRLVLSATNLQCGSLFWFSKRYLSDSRLGHISNPQLAISVAVAASAAVPPILSPMVLEFRQDEWSGGEPMADPRFRTSVHLTNGGVCDDYAIEPAWKSCRTILVSDGGSRSSDNPEPSGNWLEQAGRVLDLVTLSARTLRRRQVIEAFDARQRNGAYWSIASRMEHFASTGLSANTVQMNAVDAIPSRYEKIDAAMQESLINWGYAICDAAMRTHMGATGDPRLPYGSADTARQA